MTTRADLFDAPLIAGLDYRDAFIREGDGQNLIAHLQAEELAPFRFQGWLGKRKTRSFGWRYDFDDASFSRTEAIPGWLEPLRARAADFANVPPQDFVHVLLAR
jgi:hypothetical protein